MKKKRRLSSKRKTPLVKTLFSPDTFKAEPILSACRGTYSLGTSQLVSTPHASNEPTIFDHVARSEASLKESETLIAGDLAVEVDGKRSLNLAQRRKQPFFVKGWVEPDRLRFSSCRADGILFVEKATQFNLCCRVQAWRTLRLVLISGNGVPCVPTRRILHRISNQFGLPVFILGDNDTWGYFIFSVLKRGALLPMEAYSHLQVADVRYLGLRAGDLPVTSRNWECIWDARLEAMSKYACFKSKAWQREFRSFRDQGGKIELDASPWMALGECVGRRPLEVFDRLVVKGLLLKRLEHGQWLI